jgi:hypothetical protein
MDAWALCPGMARLPQGWRNIPNLGPAMYEDMRRLGIQEFSELRGKDPQQLYERLSKLTGTRQDPCVLDTFCALVDQASGKPARPWFYYSRERKARHSVRRRHKA